jgi:hypothetical protein
MDGFIWMIGSVVVIYVCKLNQVIDQKAVCRYWMISIPAISVFVLSILYNFLLSGVLAPYPLIYTNMYALFGILLILLISVNSVAEIFMYKKIKQ